MLTNTNNPKCPNCNKSGLAILPVRYAVVPLGANATLPKTLGNKVKDVKIAHHKYALRTLRKGFVYLYYEKHARGAQIRWEVYSVTPSGTLWKQYSTSGLRHMSEDPACSRAGHNIPASLITIEKPEKCGRVWIAFSEHAWSNATFTMFAENEKLRNERMQLFEPALWINDRGYKHALEGTQENIEQVVEYRGDFNASIIGGGTLSEISNNDGSYKGELLKKQTTRYPLYMRKNQGQRVAEAMKAAGKGANGKDHPPAMIALWDAIGITHELNGFRNDAAGWLNKYGQERELEITAKNAIETVKKILEESAVTYQDQLQQNTINNAPKISSTQERRIQAAKLSEPQRSRQIEVCDILDDWAQRQLPSTLGHVMRLNAANTYDEPRRSAEIAKIKADANLFLNTRAANAPKNLVSAKEHAWAKKYAGNLDKDVYDSFTKYHDDFFSNADAIIDKRTDDLLAWLESDALIDAFTELHQDNIIDGITFDDQVGIAIHGINSSAKGRAKIDAWVKEMKATKKNLLWRAVALNQQIGVTTVEKTLSAADQTAPIGKLSMDFLTVFVRKMADIYKKANTMQNTLAKAGNKDEGIRLVRVTDIDRVFMTVGDRLFKPFIKQGVDKAAEYAVRGLMLARAGVEPDRIMSAVKEQAKQEGLARSAIVRRMQSAKSFIGSGQDFKDAKHSELQKKWESVKGDPSKKETAFKENRLSLIVATLEIINLTKIAWEFKNDKRTFGELAAAACSTIAAVSDIAANAAKHLVSDKSVTFQYLKVFGGVVSAGAGYYAAMRDWDAAKSKSEDAYMLSVMYRLKSASQFAAATCGLLIGISYAAPLLNASSSRTLKWIGTRLLYQRLWLMTYAVRLNMVGLALTVVIWFLTPNPMEVWLEESPFGKKRKKGTKNPEVLIENLNAAMRAIS